MAVQKQDDQHEHTFSNYVRIRDVVQKTWLRRWMIGKSGEWGSGISVLPARHDDDMLTCQDFKSHIELSNAQRFSVPTALIQLNCSKYLSRLELLWSRIYVAQMYVNMANFLRSLVSGNFPGVWIEGNRLWHRKQVRTLIILFHLLSGKWKTYDPS